MIERQAHLLCDLLPDGASLDAARIGEQVHAGAILVVGRNRQLLERLSARCPLGIVSNFTGNLEPCLLELGLRRFFGAVVDSGVLGIAKPDPRAFTAALAQLEIPAADTWMVGDNYEADVRPAAGLGMRTCWLAPPDRPMPPRAVATVRIARLPDLETVLHADAPAPHA